MARARPLGVDLLHGLPRLDVVDVDARQRPVDEEQVEVVEAEVGQALVEGAQGVVAAVEAVVQLAGHEDLAAVDARAGDGLADALLVAVHLGGVDVPVADLERGRDRLGGLLGRDLVDAEARAAGSRRRCSGRWWGQQEPRRFLSVFGWRVACGAHCRWRAIGPVRQLPLRSVPSTRRSAVASASVAAGLQQRRTEQREHAGDRRGTGRHGERLAPRPRRRRRRRPARSPR